MLEPGSQRTDRSAYEGSDRFDPAYESEARPIIVGGCARSGTTLVRVILDSHRNLCCGPESGLFFRKRTGLNRLVNRFDMPRPRVLRLARESGSRAEFIDKFFGFYARRSGTRRWAEKSPRNVQVLDYVFRSFPKARFIHVIRDGRDVACSLRTFPRHEVVEGELVPLETRNPLEPGIERWVSDITAALPYRSDPRYLEVRYEDVVASTRETIAKVLEFAGEPWDEAVLRHSEFDTTSRDVAKFPQNPEATRPVTDESIGRWKRDLTREEQEVFKELAGGLLVELGYENSSDWLSRSLRT